MYTIISKTDIKSKSMSDYDYILSSFKELYDLAETISVPLTGKYDIVVHSDKIDEIISFINREQDFDSMNITVVVSSKQGLEFITLALPNARVGKGISMFELFKQEIAKRNLVIDSNALNILYATIGSSFEEIEEGLDILLDSYGSYNLINLKSISKVLTIKDITYPKQVMISYLTMYRHRKAKLYKSIDDLGEDIVLNSIRKNIKDIHERKVEYFKTGVGDGLIKSLSMHNINLMYYIFVVNYKAYPRSVKVLLSIYERGLINSVDFNRKESSLP